jgi:hypothetical protein
LIGDARDKRESVAPLAHEAFDIEARQRRAARPLAQPERPSGSASKRRMCAISGSIRVSL